MMRVIRNFIYPVAVSVIISMFATTPTFAIPYGGISSVGVAAVVGNIPTSSVWSTAAVVSFFAAGVVVAANETVGTCVSDDECNAIVRSRFPTQSSIGVGLCECYSASSAYPFDECEGDTEGCLVARCMNSCAGLEGYCLLTVEGSDGTCDLRQIIVQSNTTSSANETVGLCTTDEECSAVVRSQFPLESSAGVELCECYAASSTSPFDECEGDDTNCMMAKCTDSCDGFEGYCDSTIGACDLRQVPAQSTSPTPLDSPDASSSSNTTVGSCDSDEECSAVVRSQFPLESSEGVELCECYAASSTSPFDECEGDDTNCMMAKCTDSCAGFEGYCDSTIGACDLRQVPAQSTSPTPFDSPDTSSSSNTTVGSCTTDDECSAVIRSQFPLESSEGVELCECYAASSTSPFDECEGDDTNCMMAKCTDSCAGFEGYCLLSPDRADGTQTCVLRQVSTSISPIPLAPTTSPSPTAISAIVDKTFGSCTSDEECSVVIRSRFPLESNAGVQMCECYAASSSSPFDECEGESDETCSIAKCMDSCDGMEAYCAPSPESTNGIQTCTLRPASGSPTASSMSTNITDGKEAEVDFVQRSPGTASGVTATYSLSFIYLSIATISVLCSYSSFVV